MHVISEHEAEEVGNWWPQGKTEHSTVAALGDWDMARIILSGPNGEQDRRCVHRRRESCANKKQLHPAVCANVHITSGVQLATFSD